MSNFILLLVLVSFLPLSSSHCCHKCIWKDVNIRESIHSPYPDRTRGCSVGCNGDVLDDGTCKPGGPQFICTREGGSCNIFGCNCTEPCIRRTECSLVQLPSIEETTNAPMTPSFTKMDDHACSKSYGKYGTRKEAEFACAEDPKCKRIQSSNCLYSNDFGNFELCKYDAELTFSSVSCVYNKADINRSGRYSLDDFVDILITQCKRPNILSEFRSRIITEDKEYKNAIKKVIEDVSINIGELIFQKVPCLAIFSNCFVPTKQMRFTDLCHGNNDGTKHYKAFTFLMLFELLNRPSDCNDASDNECRFKDNQNKKTICRFLKFIVFDEEDEEEQAFLENIHVCLIQLKMIRSNDFIDLDLQQQIGAMQVINSQCLNRTAYSDYTKLSWLVFHSDDNCPEELKKCSNVSIYDYSELDVFVKATLKCNMNTMGFKLAADEKFEKELNDAERKHSKEIEKHQHYVKTEIHKLIEINITDCKEVVFDLYENPTFNLFVASKVSGVHESKENGTFLSNQIQNPNLLLNNVNQLLAMNISCKKEDEECKKLIEELKDSDFKKIPFTDQAQKKSTLIKSLINDIEKTYHNLTVENPECKVQLEKQCKDLDEFTSSVVPTETKLVTTVLITDTPEVADTRSISASTTKNTEEIATTSSTTPTMVATMADTSSIAKSTTNTTETTPIKATTPSTIPTKLPTETTPAIPTKTSTTLNMVATMADTTSIPASTTNATETTPTKATTPSTIPTKVVTETTPAISTKTSTAPTLVATMADTTSIAASTTNATETTSTKATTPSTIPTKVATETTLTIPTKTSTTPTMIATETTPTIPSKTQTMLGTETTPMTPATPSKTPTMVATETGPTTPLATLAEESTDTSFWSAITSESTQIKKTTTIMSTTASRPSTSPSKKTVSTTASTRTIKETLAVKSTTSTKLESDSTTRSSKETSKDTTRKTSDMTSRKIIEFTTHSSDDYSYKWFVNEKEYKYSAIEAAIRFHRIDSDRNGFITCEEAFNWSEEPFLGKAFDPQRIVHPFGVSDATTACRILRQKLNSVRKDQEEWPSLLTQNLNPLNEITKDGMIEPREFDGDLEKLDDKDRDHLIKEVLKHPMFYAREKNLTQKFDNF